MSATNDNEPWNSDDHSAWESQKCSCGSETFKISRHYFSSNVLTKITCTKCGNVFEEYFTGEKRMNIFRWWWYWLKSTIHDFRFKACLRLWSWWYFKNQKPRNRYWNKQQKKYPEFCATVMFESLQNLWGRPKKSEYEPAQMKDGLYVGGNVHLSLE